MSRRIKRIHVNKHVIAANRKHGRNDPPLSIKVGGENIRTHAVMILGPSAVIHRPDKPLSCGARVWIETRSIVSANGKDFD